ncbi:DivIVA domain-containing protein [Allokutzneria oryzae]|uniref:Cell wall synthesis protein Wag31 n=1 Tax=Allokutzneria oryzae TaxID=1378989 RepID=A0ABV6A0Y7_9PSEU
MTLTPEEIRSVVFAKPPRGERGYSDDDVDAFLDRVEATLRGEDTLTPQEVLEVRFPPARWRRRGYDEDAVDDFLDRAVETLKALAEEGEAREKPSAERIRAADIGKVVFKKPARGKAGYDDEEVDAFLDRIEATLRGEDSLTAKKIKAARFKPAKRRGDAYDEDQVDAFLRRITRQLEDDELADLPTEITERKAPPVRDKIREQAFRPPVPGGRGYDEKQVNAFLERIEATMRGKDTITPQQVADIRFTPPRRGKPGYDADGVDALLDRLALSLTQLPPRTPKPLPMLTAADVRKVAFHRPRPGEPGYDEIEVDQFLDRVEATLQGEDRITLKDVQRVRFHPPAPGHGGYDNGEVDAFLDLLEVRLAGVMPTERIKPVPRMPPRTAPRAQHSGFFPAPPARH